MRPVYFPASLFTYHFIFSPTCQALYISARHFFVWFTFNRLFCFSLILPLSTLSSYLLHSTRSSPSQYFESSNATETHRFTLQLSPSGRSDSSPLYFSRSWMSSTAHSHTYWFVRTSESHYGSKGFPANKIISGFSKYFPLSRKHEWGVSCRQTNQKVIWCVFTRIIPIILHTSHCILLQECITIVIQNISCMSSLQS